MVVSSARTALTMTMTFVNGDGMVGVSDLLAVIAAWGPCADLNDCPADVTYDGLVNVSDLLLVIASWG